VSTNFLQFNPGQANQETDAEYAADSQRINGAIDGQSFEDKLANKFFNQMSSMIAALAQMMSNKGYTMSDSNYATLISELGNIVTFADLGNSIITVGYSPSANFNAAGNSGFQMILSGNLSAPTISGVSPGQLLAFIFVQDGVGSRTVTWPVQFIGAQQPYFEPGSINVQMFKADTSGDILAVSGMMSSGSGGRVRFNIVESFVGFFSSLQINASASPGFVLTYDGTSFVPAALPPVIIPGQVTDVTSSRAFGTAYQNTTGSLIIVHGFGLTSGSSWIKLTAMVGAGSPTSPVWANQVGATTSSQPAGFCFPVPNGFFYRIDAGGSGSVSLNEWFETKVN
jgi:hypothetical protein